MAGWRFSASAAGYFLGPLLLALAGSAIGGEASGGQLLGGVAGLLVGLALAAWAARRVRGATQEESE